MVALGILCGLAVLTAFGVVAALVFGAGWWVLAGIAGIVLLLGLRDVLQRRHSVLRNFPVLGHMRYLLEMIRPELQQYFVERNFDGRPYDRDTRTMIYARAKGELDAQAFGTERDVNAVGHEYLVHALVPAPQQEQPPRVRVGGPDCTRPYEMSLLNVSAMSFGALSANALRALNGGAAKGGFAHDTGEGGISEHHLAPGGDLVWELGSGYFGARTDDGDFDQDMFADKAAHDSVKCVALKLSQGAKPGLGGVLPGAKVTAEIAEARAVPKGQTCVSPPGHRVFHTPRELVRFIARMRELAGGKPAGFKLCVGERVDVLAICKAMLAEGTAPDFIVVDGAEGGTGAAPAEFADHVGQPLTEGLITVHNALVGAGLREKITLGASGKVATGSDIIKRLVQGADYTNAARAMMMATGCIQSQRCHTNLCPVGVATQDPRRARALDVPDKTERVYRYQRATVSEAMRLMASMGVTEPGQLRPEQLMRRIGHLDTRSYAELFTWLAPGQLVAEPPADWAADWHAANADHFGR